MPNTSPRKTAAKKVEPEVKAEAPLYHIGIDFVDGQRFDGEGATLTEALENLARPIKVMSKGFIKVTSGDTETNLFMMPAQMKRFFYPLARPTTAKMLALGLKLKTKS